MLYGRGTFGFSSFLLLLLFVLTYVFITKMEKVFNQNHITTFRGKYFPSNSSWFPRDLKVVPYFFKKSWKSKKVRPSNIQLFKLGFHGGPSFFDFQLFYQQKFSGKEIEYGLAAIIQL